MEKSFKIELNYKKTFSFGILNSGYDLFHYLYIENLTEEAFKELKISVKTTPDILLEGEHVVDFVAPSGYCHFSCDFIKLNKKHLAGINLVTDVSISVCISMNDGTVLSRADFSCKILPFDRFCGLSDMPETLSFFVTPDQNELSQIEVKEPSLDPIDYCHQLYDTIKALQITFSSQDYSGNAPLQVRLCERVLREKTANPMELSLLFASVCERAGFSPILAFVGKGKVFTGISLRQKPLKLLSYFERGNKDLEGLHFIDGSYLAYGSELNFDSALFNSKNFLSLSDEKILVLDIRKARKMHLLPLPNRIQQGAWNELVLNSENESTGGFDEYFSLTRQYADNPLITTILTGNKIKAEGQKYSIPFCHNLDVNQNKILAKILGNQFTLIRAVTGGGATTLFSAAIEHVLKNKKSVLYITDKEYHSAGFRDVFATGFDPAFVLDLTGEDERFEKSRFEGFFSDREDAFGIRKKLSKTLEEMDTYYENLEGEKRIASSFLFAADRYHQLRDANDSVVFSPEQIGMLSDEMVQTWFNIINELVRSFTENRTIHANPLLLIREKNFSYEYKSKVIRQLEEILHCIESIMQVREQIVGFFPSIDTLRSFHGFYAFQDLIRLFSEFNSVPESFFEQPRNIEENFRKATQLIQAKKENDSIIETIQISFQKEIFELDARDLYIRYQSLINDKGFKAIAQKHGILKTVKRYLRPNCDVENIEYILSRLYSYHQNAELIQNEKEEVFRLLSVPNFDDANAWEKLQVASDLCYQAYSVFLNSFTLESLSDFVSDFRNSCDNIGIAEKLVQLRELSEEYIHYKDELEKTVQNQLEFFYPQASVRDQDYFSIIHQELSSVFSVADHLKSWCAWLSIREDALKIGLKNIVNTIEAGRIHPDELKRSFLRAFFKAVCEFNFIKHPELVPDGMDMDAAIGSCKDALRENISISKSELDTVLTMRRFDALAELGADSFYPLDLFRNDPGCFSDVFPVVVCDVERAKREFSSSKDHFDLVVIESRNSISLSDFIWTLHTGKKVAFAGALSLSRRGVGDTFDLSTSAFDYLWNICEEKYSLSAVYSGEPCLTALKKSYAQGIRTDLRIYTVPATVYSQVSSWVRIPGTFDTEYPGANLAEAEYCADSVLRFAEKTDDRTLGVITSTAAQKNLILRILAQKLRQQEERSTIAGRFEKIHVIAAGEDLIPCDEIIYSATYAPDRSLHGARLPFVSLEFGKGDPYKLIFQILSCAKSHITVLTSFGNDELRFSPSALPFVSAVGLLLSVLKAPCINNTYSLTGTFDNDSVIKHVKTELENAGFRVLDGVYSGRYYIDLAVLDQNDQFILGIISDQTVMNQKANISAIEIGNSNFYEKCGWKLYRLRSPQAFDSFDGEMDQIFSILNHGINDNDLI